MIYDICLIGGAGRVGLPLSIVFSLCGFRTVIYDTDFEKIDKIRAGFFPFREENGETELKKAIETGNIFFSYDREDIRHSENVILTINTPIDEHLNPDFSLIDKIKDEYFDFFSSEHHIILRSTVFPGFSEILKKELIKKNLNCDLSFCPERIAEGYAFRELRELPQIISSFSEEGYTKCEKIFGKITDEIIKVTVAEAELAKLFNNAYRYIKFACSNQFYTIANDLGIDFYNVYKAATHNYPRASDMPKAGFSAGPCLYKDTLQLSHFSEGKFLIGKSAIEINENLPMYIARRLNKKYDLKEKNILILGMSFKKDSDNLTESLAVRLKKIFGLFTENVICHDPFVEKYRQKNTDDIISNADIIIIGAPHEVFKDYPLDDKLVIDIWNFLECGESRI